MRTKKGYDPGSARHIWLFAKGHYDAHPDVLREIIGKIYLLEPGSLGDWQIARIVLKEVEDGMVPTRSGYLQDMLEEIHKSMNPPLRSMSAWTFDEAVLGWALGQLGCAQIRDGDDVWIELGEPDFEAEEDQ